MLRSLVAKLAIIVTVLSLSLAACNAPEDKPRLAPTKTTAKPARGFPTQSPSVRNEKTSSEECTNGWIEPGQGTGLYEIPLRAIATAMQVEPRFRVKEMRYFEGPESPPSVKGYLAVVKRWYVKGWPSEDPSMKGRWLVERREFGTGVAAVAPWDTEGFEGRQWWGFQHDSSDPSRRRYRDLPGRWAGIPYNFVKGGSGLDNPGLPLQLMGCLEGT